MTICSRIDLCNASEQELIHLTDTCSQATFGRGQENVLDETYRKAKKLDLNDFATTFDVLDTGIMSAVYTHLLDGSSENQFIRAELYKLNVYDKGSFFKAHKDTPRGGNMFASLVIIFATEHQGGSLILRHDGREWAYDSAKELADLSSTPSVGYVSFFSDVEHEVTPVTSGHRVTLTYNLYLEDRAFKSTLLPTQPSSNFGNTVNDLPALLADDTFLPQGGILGFGLRHQYPVDAVHPESTESLQQILKVLKGGDKALYNALKAVGIIDPVVYVAFTDSEDTLLVLVDHVPSSGDQVDGLERRYLRWVLAEREGSILAKDDEEQAVTWITEITTYSRTRVDFGTYGNEPGLDFVYGDFCLACNIGPAGQRV
ncbi:hypothetical protein K435DRAFT_762164 [Dendrothele bispora CBS 962.96]|uniref:Fe2OG dioxygenase domain-containing protein n=1 Tax=Dendrothele bispora (strain CBS 962.96) TaxID=1314807 RepID=A0A4S8LGC8_DENBC|nr:hypothetical protein K435DRAFT_762164 [Dendrothele bispora CBS 962.96]